MDDFLICAGSLTFFGIIFGFILVMRYLAFKETLIWPSISIWV